MSVAPEQGPRPQPIKSTFALLSFFAAAGCAFLVSEPRFIIPADRTISVPWFDGEQKILDQGDLQLVVAAIGVALVALAALLRPKG